MGTRTARARRDRMRIIGTIVAGTAGRLALHFGVMMAFLTRRQLLNSAALALFQRKRPNVLIFMTDQESALLPGPAELPHRRRIERDAVRFTTAFCNTPQCFAAPSTLL